MATKKVKRYEEGDYVTSDEDTNAGMKEAYDNRASLDTSDEDLSRGGKESAAAAAPAKQSFSQAFAAARKGGGKTFEYNGKKYTTDVASSKPAAAKETPKPAAAPAPTPAASQSTRPAAEAPKRTPGVIRGTSVSDLMDMYSKAKKAREESAKSEPKVDTSKMTAKAAGKAAQERGVNAGAMSNFKKGGKINGIAQRGKTRGRIC